MYQHECLWVYSCGHWSRFNCSIQHASIRSRQKTRKFWTYNIFKYLIQNGSFGISKAFHYRNILYVYGRIGTRFKTFIRILFSRCIFGVKRGSLRTCRYRVDPFLSQIAGGGQKTTHNIPGGGLSQPNIYTLDRFLYRI